MKHAMYIILIVVIALLEAAVHLGWLAALPSHGIVCINGQCTAPAPGRRVYHMPDN